jgi:hypothetical protein
MKNPRIRWEMGDVEGKEVTPPVTPLSIQHAFEQISKDDVNGFTSTSDTCFMIPVFQT